MWPYVDLAGIRISTYFLAHFVAIPVVGLLALRRFMRFRQPAHRFIFGMAALILAAILGAVAFHYLVHGLHRLVSAGQVGQIEKGSTIMGVLLGGGLFSLWAIRHYHGPVGRVFDAGIPMLPLGQAFGRVGCFLGGCCYGRPTDSWLAMRLPGEGGVWLPRYPTQLLSAGADLAICAALLLVERWGQRRGRLPFDGFLTVLYGLLYFPKRFLMEFVRDERPLVWGPFTWAHATSLLGLIVAISIGVACARRASRQEEVAAAP